MTPRAEKKPFGLDVLVLGTVLGIVATVATYSFLNEPAPSDPIEETLAVLAEPETRPAVLEGDVDDRVRKLEADLVEALARIDRLYEEREYAWQQTSAWVDSILDALPSEPTPRAELMKRFRSKLEIRKRAESGKMLAGLDDALFLMFATALAGEDAVRELCEVVRDETANLDFRVEAFDSLGYLPSEDTLDMLLNPPPDVATAAGYDPSDNNDLGRFALMAEFLPTASIARFEPSLYAMAVDRLNEEPSDGEAWSLIAVLAFEHGNEDASKLMNNPRTLQYFGKDVLQVAWWAGSAESKAYIQRIASSHPDPGLRQQATEILIGWP